MIEIKAARLCQECFAVTPDDACPRCDTKTIPHPEQLEEQKYCCECGGEFHERDLVVWSWHDDPYMQVDDGMLITVCRTCDIEEQIEYA